MKKMQLSNTRVRFGCLLAVSSEPCFNFRHIPGKELTDIKDEDLKDEDKEKDKLAEMYVDGMVVARKEDGTPPEPPEGFTIITSKAGTLVLRRIRQRNLKNLGMLTHNCPKYLERNLAQEKFEGYFPIK